MAVNGIFLIIRAFVKPPVLLAVPNLPPLSIVLL